VHLILKISSGRANVGIADFLRSRLLYLDVKRLSIDISSVANLYNIDNSQLIIDGVNDPIAALTDTIKV